MSRGTGNGGPEVRGSNGFGTNCVAAGWILTTTTKMTTPWVAIDLGRILIASKSWGTGSTGTGSRGTGSTRTGSTGTD